MIVYACNQRFMPIEERKFQNWEQLKAKHQAEGTVCAGVQIMEKDNPLTIMLHIKLAVREKKHGARSIWLLRLCAHGFCGCLELGTGLRWNPTGAFKSAFSELASQGAYPTR